MWHSTTPSSSLPHTCKRAFRAVLPERHQHLSCVVCPGSFAHVAFGLGLFALVAFVRAEKAESRGRPVLGPVVCLRFHSPAKFNFARALTHHPRRWGLGIRGWFFVLLVVVPTPKNEFASAEPSRRESHISAIVLADRESSRNVVSTTGRGATRGEHLTPLTPTH